MYLELYLLKLKLLRYEALFFAISVEVKSESKLFVYLYIMKSCMTSATDLKYN